MKKIGIVLVILTVVFFVWIFLPNLPIDFTNAQYENLRNSDNTFNKDALNKLLSNQIISCIITGVVMFSITCMVVSKKAKLTKKDIRIVIAGFIIIILIIVMIHSIYLLQKMNTVLDDMEDGYSRIMEEYNQESKPSKQYKENMEHIKTTYEIMKQSAEHSKFAILPIGLIKIAVGGLVVSITLLLCYKYKTKNEFRDNRERQYL